jgi:hypothetical protein
MDDALLLRVARSLSARLIEQLVDSGNETVWLTRDEALVTQGFLDAITAQINSHEQSIHL